MPAPLLRYRCAGCGYGASRRSAPDRCPMCGGASFDEDGWKPFANFSADLASATGAVPTDADAPLGRELAETSILPGVPLS